MLVYLNGDYLPAEEARVPVDDRGFLFADGVYEVARVHDGRALLLAEHLARMERGLKALRIEGADPADIAEAAGRLVQQNGHTEGDTTIYIQVTRGAAPRKHAFPSGVEPTVYVATRPFTPHPTSSYDEGVDAILLGDDRWARCDIKSVSLLPNVLANQRAHEQGAFEALFVRDGIVLEGSHSNLWGVLDGELVTYPACNYILAGITRGQVFDYARELGIPAREGFIPQARLHECEELFLSGTTTEVMPIVRVDGRKIDDGEPGPVTLRLLERYRQDL